MSSSISPSVTIARFIDLGFLDYALRLIPDEAFWIAPVLIGLMAGLNAGPEASVLSFAVLIHTHPLTLLSWAETFVLLSASTCELCVPGRQESPFETVRPGGLPAYI